MLKIILFGLLLFLSSTLFASSVYFNKKYYVQFHFTKEAYGKSVRDVYAHYGVLVEEKSFDGSGESDGLFWDDINHVKMNDTGDNFYYKTIMEGNGYFTSGPYRKVLGVVVQYWIYFEDGNLKVTDDFHLSRCVDTFHLYYSSETTASISNKLKALIEDFKDMEDGEETNCLIEVANFK